MTCEMGYSTKRLQGGLAKGEGLVQRHWAWIPTEENPSSTVTCSPAQEGTTGGARSRPQTPLLPTLGIAEGQGCSQVERKLRGPDGKIGMSLLYLRYPQQEGELPGVRFQLSRINVYICTNGTVYTAIFICIISFNPNSHPLREFISLCYGWGK